MKKKSSQKHQMIRAAAISGFICIIGLLLSAFSIVYYLDNINVQYKEINATILFSEKRKNLTESEDTGTNVNYNIYLTCAYRISGVEYQDNLAFTVSKYSNLSNYDTGKKIKVYYNPEIDRNFYNPY